MPTTPTETTRLPTNPQLDRLTGQLYYLPAIIERLGLGICEAQKGLNLDYLNSVRRLMALLEPVLKDVPEGEAKGAIIELLKALAPSRYQFSETTLTFRADLSESLDFAGKLEGGLSAGFGMAAVAVNASLALGFSYDYRAAAEIKTVLHAIPMDEKLLGTLLARVPTLKDNELPALTQVDNDIKTAGTAIANALKPPSA